MPEAFEISIPVEAADIDELGHVNNVVYLRWVQDVAIAHWTARAPAADRGSVYWVVVRHEIDYKLAAQLGDEIVARTWVGTATRVRFERHTELLRANDRRLLAQARTLWCAMDARTRRPTGVSEAVRTLFSTAEPAHAQTQVAE
jgi:acyl-CoA thioester hydrolase